MRIIVDSTCDLPQEKMKELGVEVIPARILLGEMEYYDGVDIDLEFLYKEMRRGVVPKTSQPNMLNVKEIFERYAKDGDDFIYMAFTGAMSGTYGTAKMIMDEIRPRYPKVRMEVFDTKAGSAGIGLMLMAVKEEIKEGASFNEVMESLHYYSNNLDHFFTLYDLHWLNKGGRISKSKAIVGTAMKIKPILRLQDGVIDKYRCVRGEKKVLRELTSEALKLMDKRDYRYVAVVHGEDVAPALKIADALKSEYPDREYLITEVGIGLASHLGIEGAGVILMSKKK